ncbi:MAG: hypothetical protein K2N91_01890 [Muribaculaceae bacterium]|nr:hypothetical protein [Muribaculaceae bacterium]
MSNRDNANMPKGFRLFFGIFMGLVFIGAGLMLLFNWFNVIYDPSWNLLRWIGGPIFILYGFFRGYRLYKGNPMQNEG